MSLIFLDTKSSVVTSRVITWNDSELITLLIMDKYNAQEPRTVNTINNGNITLLCIPLKNSLIIHDENTKKNHKRVVSVYVIQIHVDLHKLKL